MMRSDVDRVQWVAQIMPEHGNEHFAVFLLARHVLCDCFRLGACEALAFALRQIARHLGKAEQLAIGAVHCGDDDVRPELRMSSDDLLGGGIGLFVGFVGSTCSPPDPLAE